MPLPIPAEFSQPVTKAFWAKVEKRGRDECWGWKGSFHKKKPFYPMFFYWDPDHKVTRNFIAQRAMWIIERDLIPEGRRQNIVTTCGNQQCMNPAHLSMMDNSLLAHRWLERKHLEPPRPAKPKKSRKRTEAQKQQDREHYRQMIEATKGRQVYGYRRSVS